MDLGLQLRARPHPRGPSSQASLASRPLWRSARTAASPRPASLEAERPLPPDPRNRPGGTQGCSRGAKRGLFWLYQPKVGSRGPAGAPKGQPFDSLGPSPDPSPLPLPTSQHPVPLGFHLLPCPKACDPWAERRCFCLLDSLGHHLLNQARPTFMIFLASSTGHTCCGLLALCIITAPNLLGKLTLSLQDPAQSLLLGEARHGLLVP